MTNQITINHINHNCYIHIVGTAHVSTQSIQNVEYAYEQYRPDCIAIELDEKRLLKMVNDDRHTLKIDNDYDEISFQSIFKETSKRNQFFLNLILQNYESNLAKNLGVQLGGEMIKGYELAQTNNISFELIDRNIDVTFNRINTSLSYRTYLKIIYNSIFSKKLDIDIESILDDDSRDTEKIISYMNTIIPEICEALIFERDRYMAYKLYNLSHKYSNILVIVGDGHKNGILNQLTQLNHNGYSQKNQIDYKKITSFNRKPKNYFGLCISILISLIMGYILLSTISNPELLKQLTLEWILLNCIFASMGALFARGNIFTILSAGLSAPITSLIPFIGAGYVAGLVESKYLKISKNDLKIASTMKFTYSNCVSNPITKLLLIILSTNLGSAFATLIFIKNIF